MGLREFARQPAAGAGLPEFKGNVALAKSDVLWNMEAEAVVRKGWREAVLALRGEKE